jgi:streptogramin lyase
MRRFSSAILGLALLLSACASPNTGGGLPAGAFLVSRSHKMHSNAAQISSYTAVRFLPAQIIPAPDGSVWFLAYQRPYVGHVLPSGAVTYFRVPSLHRGPPTLSGIALARNGTLWFNAGQFDGACDGGIGYVAGGRLKLIRDKGCGSGGGGLTIGNDGRLYETQYPNVIEVFTSSGIYERRFTYTKCGEPGWIANGPDGNLWISSGHWIVKMSERGVTQCFVVPHTNGNTYMTREIVNVGDGNLWFVEREMENASGQKVARITTQGKVTEFALTQPNYPIGLSRAPDGAIWFADATAPSSIGTVSPSGSISYSIVTNSISAEFSAMTSRRGAGEVWAGGIASGLSAPYFIGTITQ